MTYDEERECWETRKFALQLVVALGTAFAGGAAMLGLILHWMGKI